MYDSRAFANATDHPLPVDTLEQPIEIGVPGRIRAYHRVLMATHMPRSTRRATTSSPASRSEPKLLSSLRVENQRHAQLLRNLLQSALEPRGRPRIMARQHHRAAKVVAAEQGGLIHRPAVRWPEARNHPIAGFDPPSIQSIRRIPEG